MKSTVKKQLELSGYFGRKIKMHKQKITLYMSRKSREEDGSRCERGSVALKMIEGIQSAR